MGFPVIGLGSAGAGKQGPGCGPRAYYMDMIDDFFQFRESRMSDMARRIAK